MNKKTKILLVCLGVLLVAFIGAVIYQAIKSKPKADIAKNPRADSGLAHWYQSGADFKPGEVVVKLKSSETKNAKSIESSLKSGNITSSQATVQNVKNLSGGQMLIKLDLKISSKSVKTLGQPAKDLIWRVKNCPYTFPNQDCLSLDDRLALKMTNDIAQKMAADPRFEAVNLVHIYQAFGLSNDTYLNPSGDNKTWSKGAWGQSYEDLWNIKMTNTDKAWDISKGKGVVVAVVDTGVDYLHEDIAANILTTDGKLPQEDGSNVRGKDMVLFSEDFGEVPPMDWNGHGTHVAGIVAAIRNNKKGIAGVAPEAKIMPIRVLDGRGYGSDLNIAEGIRWAVDNGARIINLSLGGYGSNSLIDSAVQYALNKKVVMVVAAGNDSWDSAMYSPAANQDVICVGAASEKKQAAFFSNFGDNLTVTAPGGGSAIATMPGQSWFEMVSQNPNINNILSLKSSNNQFSDPETGGSKLFVGDKYLRLAGTSMASPFVAGTAALILAKNPGLTSDQVKSVLAKSANDVLDPISDGSKYPGWDSYSGFGLVDSQKALSTAPSDPITASIYGGKILTLNSKMLSTPIHNIQGSARGNSFKKYTLSYAKTNFENLNYYPAAWTKIIESNGPVNNNLLGPLQTVVLKDAEKPIVIIKLEVENKDGYKKTVTQTILTGMGEAAGFPRMTAALNDNTIQEGLPVDLNGDGAKEYVFVDFYNQLHALDVSGSIIPGWEISSPSGGFYGPVVAINQADKKKFIVVAEAFKKETGDYGYKLHYYPANFQPTGQGALTVDLPGDANKGIGPVGVNVVKDKSRILILVDLQNQINFYDLQGKLVKTISNISTFSSIALGDIDNDKGEEVVFAGMGNVNNELRQGVFAINLQNWSIRNIYLLSSRESQTDFLTHVFLADFDRDQKIDFLVDRFVNSTKTKIITISSTGQVMGQTEYGAYYSFFGPMPAVEIVDLSDINKDGSPEIGLANFDKFTIDRVSYQGKLINQFPYSMTAYWATGDLNGNLMPEIVDFEISGQGALGGGQRLEIKSTSGQKISSYSLVGALTVDPGPPIIWVSSGRIMSMSSAFTPWGRILHKFDLGAAKIGGSAKTAPSNAKLDWPMPMHDLRRTNNYSAEQVE